MVKFLVAVIMIAVFYVGIGVIVEFVKLKAKDKSIQFDKETAMRVLKWPTQLKGF